MANMPDDPSDIFTAASQAEQAQEMARLQSRLRDAERLNRILITVTAALDPSAAFTTICDELAQAFQVPQVALAIMNNNRTALDVVAEYCAPGRVSGLGEQIVVKGNPIMDRILTTKAPLIVADAQHDPQLPASVRDLFTRRQTVSVLIMPILIQGEVNGTVGIDAVTRREFTAEEVTFALHVAVAISQALYNAQLHATVQQELAERKRVEAIILAQEATLAELSTPLIPLTDKVLVLPLIGIIDAARARQITDTLLTGVARYQAQTIIIDITGLPLVDTHVATVLTQTARALQLLGANTVITGIRPEVAQTFVYLGNDLHGVRTFGTLQDGIRFAIRSL